MTICFVDKMMDKIEKKRNGLLFIDDGTLDEKKEKVRLFQKKWLEPFYKANLFDSSGQFDDLHCVHLVVKRFCYETFGYNLFTSQELKNESFYQHLLSLKKEISNSNEDEIFNIYLFLQESRMINKIYEDKELEKEDRSRYVQDIKDYFFKWSLFKDSIWKERDGFGLYRTIFEWNHEEKEVFCFFNREDEYEDLVFKSISIDEKEFLSRMNNFSGFGRNMIKKASHQVKDWLAEEGLHLLPVQEVSFKMVSEDEKDRIYIYYKGNCLQNLIQQNGVCYRSNGNTVYNNDTIVREIYESVTYELNKKRDAERKAYNHFLNTLSPRDVIAKDHILLRGNEYDYLLLRSGVYKTDFIRIEKGKPLSSQTVKSLCIHPKETWVPRFDGFATFSMMIKSGKEQLLNQIANAHPVNQESFKETIQLYN